MGKKSKNSSAAENLIESLIDDVKGLEKTNASSDKKMSGDEFVLEHTKGAAEASYYADAIPDGDDYEDSVQIFGDNDAPAGLEDFAKGLPASEDFNLDIPSASEDAYQGPAFHGGYQSADDIYSAAPDVFSAPDPVPARMSKSEEDKTVSLQQDSPVLTTNLSKATDADKTIAVDGFANGKPRIQKIHEADVKVSIGHYRGGTGRGGNANVMTSVDASLAQAENLKIAQQRILELEREVEGLRAENEELASAGEIIHSRADELGIRITSLEKEKTEQQESHQSEVLVLKGNLQYKESEVAKARIKVEELEARLKSDFKKIRVRERELENRLELLRAEKAALVRSKDEYILDLKRKIDQLSMELDNYRKKCLELNKTIEANQDQVKRTERALRLALTNLEVKESSAVPLKKAE